jgi:hypothetical protein
VRALFEDQILTPTWIAEDSSTTTAAHGAFHATEPDLELAGPG